MIKTSLIVMFALAVKLSICTEEDSSETIFNVTAPLPMFVCIVNGMKATIGAFHPLHGAITAAQNDSNKRTNLLRELQNRLHYVVWYKVQVDEWEKSSKVWSTLKTDLDSQMKILQYTRIRVWLETLDAFFFPPWLLNAKSFTRYEKWLIGCSTCQDEGFKIFKQAINEEYGNSTTERTIAVAKAISDLHSEVSSGIPYYYAMSMEVPETDGEIADLCSVVGKPTTMKYLACTNPPSILYGIIRIKNACEPFKVTTENFTNANSEATTTGVENCIMNIYQFTENTNLVTFFATCPRTVTVEELKKKLSPLVKTRVLNLESDLKIFKGN